MSDMKLLAVNVPRARIAASGEISCEQHVTVMGLIAVMNQNYYFSAKQKAKRLHGFPASTVSY